MFELIETSQQNAVIKVVGVGGGGGNAVQHMIAERNIAGVDFIVANTDVQALQHSSANTFGIAPRPRSADVRTGVSVTR